MSNNPAMTIEQKIEAVKAAHPGWFLHKAAYQKYNGWAWLQEWDQEFSTATWFETRESAVEDAFAKLPPASTPPASSEASYVQPPSEKMGICNHQGHSSARGIMIDHRPNEYCINWRPRSVPQEWHQANADNTDAICGEAKETDAITNGMYHVTCPKCLALKASPVPPSAPPEKNMEWWCPECGTKYSDPGLSKVCQQCHAYAGRTVHLERIVPAPPAEVASDEEVVRAIRYDAHIMRSTGIGELKYIVTSHQEILGMGDTPEAAWYRASINTSVAYERSLSTPPASEASPVQPEGESDEDAAAKVASIVPSEAAMRVSRLMYEANEEAVCEVFGKPRRPADLSSRPLIGAKMIQLAIDEAVTEALKAPSPSPIPASQKEDPTSVELAQVSSPAPGPEQDGELPPLDVTNADRDEALAYVRTLPGFESITAQQVESQFTQWFVLRTERNCRERQLRAALKASAGRVEGFEEWWKNSGASIFPKNKSHYHIAEQAFQGGQASRQASEGRTFEDGIRTALDAARHACEFDPGCVVHEAAWEDGVNAGLLQAERGILALLPLSVGHQQGW